MRAHRLLVGLLLCPLVAFGTTIIPHTLAQRAQSADRVVLAQVVGQTVEDVAAGNIVPFKTVTSVIVGDELKGSGPRELKVVQLGGRRGAETIEVPGDARFHVGETAVLFLQCRVAADRCHLVAMGAGKLDVVGEHVFVQDLFTGAWSRRPYAELAAELRAVRPAPAGAPGTVTR
jgi:hypothetical protein